MGQVVASWIHVGPSCLQNAIRTQEPKNTTKTATAWGEGQAVATSPWQRPAPPLAVVVFLFFNDFFGFSLIFFRAFELGAQAAGQTKWGRVGAKMAKVGSKLGSS